MIIGIDLRPLQNGNKYRGIGEVTKQVVNRLLEYASRDGHNIIFYEADGDDPKNLLEMPKSLNYSVIKQGKLPELDSSSKLNKLKRNFKELYGNSIVGSEKADVFLQFDFMSGVPTNTRAVLVEHDIIPYLFWDQYFESPWIPFKHMAARTTLRTLFNNYRFMRLMRRSFKNASTIISVSKNTKRDIEKHFHVDPNKSKVALLGVDTKLTKTGTPVAKNDPLPTKPYLLFIGAGDARRRIEDAVSAYNNLKAKGHDIQLVLAGENFTSPEKIPNLVLRRAVMKSSYGTDILTMGYISDQRKKRLLEGALAFVYPTLYEGFGIPILEAFLNNCPVIVYKNSSVTEVGGDHAIYVKDWQGIEKAAVSLLAQTNNERSKLAESAKKFAKGFTWDKTTRVVFDELRNLGK